MPSGAVKGVPQPVHLHSADNGLRHTGHASSSRTLTCLEDRVDEGREGFHGGREDQDQAEDA